MVTGKQISGTIIGQLVVFPIFSLHFALHFLPIAAAPGLMYVRGYVLPTYLKSQHILQICILTCCVISFFRVKKSHH